jgi:chromosome segregation ATPase
MDQESFPDLQGWEDSAQKIKAAHDAVSKLRIHHSKQQDELQSEEEKLKAKQEFAQRQQEVTRSQQTLRELNDRLTELSSKLGSQEAGYKFQDASQTGEAYLPVSDFSG